MAALRSNLEGDVHNVTVSARAVAENARAMADWRYIVRRFPFATAGVAAAVGYLIVPRRSEVIVPDPETLAQMAKLNQVWVKTGAPKASEKQGGLMASLLALGASAATRFAMNWASEHFKSSVASAAKQAHEHTQGDSQERQPQASKYPPR